MYVQICLKKCGLEIEKVSNLNQYAWQSFPKLKTSSSTVMAISLATHLCTCIHAEHQSWKHQGDPATNRDTPTPQQHNRRHCQTGGADVYVHVHGCEQEKSLQNLLTCQNTARAHTLYITPERTYKECTSTQTHATVFIWTYLPKLSPRSNHQTNKWKKQMHQTAWLIQVKLSQGFSFHFFFSEK